MKLLKTKNYAMFRYLDGNRNIVKAHVKKLKDSIVKANLLESNPIIVNGDYEVIDGQHRLAVAEQLDEYIYYIILQDSALDHVHLLNENMKKWSMQDYVDSYVALGYEDYIILNDFSKQYKLPIGICMILTADNGEKEFAAFKQGKFKINNLKVAEITANYLRDFEPYCDKGITISQDFSRAIRLLVRGNKVDIPELIRKTAATNKKVHREASAKLYLRVLEDIYNKFKRFPVRFF